MEKCKDYLQQIIEKMDDTINLSEMNPIGRTPERDGNLI